jgi:hypothetical protein
MDPIPKLAGGIGLIKRLYDGFTQKRRSVGSV